MPARWIRGPQKLRMGDRCVVQGIAAWDGTGSGNDYLATGLSNVEFCSIQGRAENDNTFTVDRNTTGTTDNNMDAPGTVMAVGVGQASTKTYYIFAVGK